MALPIVKILLSMITNEKQYIYINIQQIEMCKKFIPQTFSVVIMRTNQRATNDQLTEYLLYTPFPKFDQMGIIYKSTERLK